MKVLPIRGSIHGLRLFLAVPLLAAAACSVSAPAQKGYGFGPPGGPVAPAVVRSENAGQGVRAPGLYRTETGVPHYVFESTSAQRGRGPLSRNAAMRDARSYASSRWTEPYATRVTDGEASGMFRITTVDGHSFAVMKKVRTGSFFSTLVEKDAIYRGLMARGIQMAGCVPAGPAVVELGQYSSLKAVTAPANC